MFTLQNVAIPFHEKDSDEQLGIVLEELTEIMNDGEHLSECMVTLEALTVMADEGGVYTNLGGMPHVHAVEKLHAKAKEYIGKAQSMIAMPYETNDRQPSLDAAMASGEDYTVSLEGIRSTINDIWRTIVKIIAYIWEKLAEFYHKLTTSTKRLTLTAKRIAGEIKHLPNTRAKVDTVDLGYEVFGLSIDGKEPSDGYAIYRGVDRLKQQYIAVATHYLPRIDSIGSTMATAMQHFRVEQEQEWLHMLNRSAEQLRLKELGAHIGTLSLIWNGIHANGTAFAPPSLPGSKTLILVDTSKTIAGDATEVDKAAAYQGCKLYLSSSGSASETPPYAMRVMPPAIMSNIVNEVVILLEELAQLGSHDFVAKFKTHATVMRNVGDKIKSDNEAMASTLRHGLLYNATYATWATQPIKELVPHVLYVVRSALVAVRKHSQAFK